MSRKNSQNTDGIKRIAQNKRAYKDFEILEKLEAGIVLTGSEIKSIRQGNINLSESYVKPNANELFLVGCHVSPYSHGGHANHEPMREKKLLLHRREIKRLGEAVKQKGLTIIPLAAYLRSGKCKLEIGIGRGKKLYDKREDLKAKEAKRDVDRALRRSGQ